MKKPTFSVFWFAIALIILALGAYSSTDTAVELEISQTPDMYTFRRHNSSRKRPGDKGP